MQPTLQRVRDMSIRFGNWWLSELAALIPARLANLTRSSLVVERRDGEWIATLVRGGRAVVRGALKDEPIRRALGLGQSQPGHVAVKAYLSVPEPEVLSRLVNVPSRVVPQFARVLQIEADRWTPYDHDEVFIAWQKLGGGETESTRSIEIRFVQRSRIETWRRELQDLGILPVRLILGPLPGHSIPIRDQSGLQMKPFKAWLVTAAVVMTWLVAISVDVAVAVSNRSAWQDRLGAERQGFSVQRKLQDEIARMVATIKQGELARANPRGALLASLSVALPRTDWLTELAIKGDAVTLRGYALKIDELTKALERVTGQGEVQYQGETAYDARTERTRFAASFRMPSIAP